MRKIAPSEVKPPGGFALEQTTPATQPLPDTALPMNKSLLTPLAAVITLAAFLACASRAADKPRATKAAPATPPPGVLITSAAGARFVGDQLDAFTREGSVLTAKKAGFISLYLTEGKPFRLTGEVWLGGPSTELPNPADLPEGFTIWLREWDGLHRYSMNNRSLVIKRRPHDGQEETKIVPVASFPEAPLGVWLPFSIEATAAQIAYKFDKASGFIRKPAMDGANRLALAPGSKLREVRLTLLDE
ncbi:MAG: hypothetical protein RL514_1367 [Verrucomicrobiota bacterium]|jgi:hypothetical protein